MMCFDGTRNDRDGATYIHQAKYFSGKVSAQKKPNLVEFASRSNRWTQLNRVERENGEFSTTGGADALEKWITGPAKRAQASALTNARLRKTPIKWRLYSALPSRSSTGSAACAKASAASASCLSTCDLEPTSSPFALAD